MSIPRRKCETRAIRTEDRRKGVFSYRKDSIPGVCGHRVRIRFMEVSVFPGAEGMDRWKTAGK